ncbi:YcxB family protein [Kangiella sp. TOML190]|uniref:YcxB family protein n=1 Tax=Kangiella sp. TOML190 TaxID=2931351 RepID=UPI00203E1A9D|nr:YcxB family protein [Kangiella sp. TOML190]
MELTIINTTDTWELFQKGSVEYLAHKKPLWIKLITQVSYWAIAIFVALAIFKNPLQLDLKTVVWTSSIFILFLIVIAIESKNQQSSALPNENSTFLGEIKYKLDERGIYSSNHVAKSFVAWKAVTDIYENDKAILVHLDTFKAYIFPKDQLDKPEDLLTFLTSNLTPQ